MLRFDSDYMEVCHPAILQRFSEICLDKYPGYGEDDCCKSAAEKISAACGMPQAQVTFTVGGTQTNDIVIDALLRPYEGVVAAQTGHIAAHEAGAIEHSGHKVLTLPGKDGKLMAHTLEDYLKTYFADENHEHMVRPGMVYISHPTEYGTLYTKGELEALHECCKRYSLPLFLDGARLGYGLAGRDTDVTLPDVAALTDVFYIGGTKVGAMFGEAVVFTGVPMPAHMVSIKKQHGGLLAKGFLLGIQYDVLFTDGLYMQISQNAVDRAMEVRELLLGKGYELLIDSPTNQQFVILPDEDLARLREKVSVAFWEKVDAKRTAVRFATSWATTPEQIRALAALL